MKRWHKFIASISITILSLLFMLVHINPMPASATSAELNTVPAETITYTENPIQAYHDAEGELQLVTIDIESVEPYFENYSLEYYAYMNIHSVEPNLIPVILEARNRIIFSSSWTDDNTEGTILDENGNIIETVPLFHDVFPADWEVPCFPSSSDEHPIYHYG